MNLRVVDEAGHRLDTGAADAYLALLQAARLDGIEAPSLEIVSAYRSRERQQELWDAALRKYGSAEAARKWVAPPGGSGHEKGRAIDFNIGGMGLDKDGADKMREHPAFKWLEKNGGRFGFKPYSAEPWHWEYKGSIEAAVSALPPWVKWAGIAIAVAGGAALLSDEV